MKFVATLPYGSSHPESGLIALTANYIRVRYSETSQLLCNGVFSLCDRDAEVNWNRQLHSCAACGRDQLDLATWAGIAPLNLSSYLRPDEIWESKRWISSLSIKELKLADYKGLSLHKLCIGTFRNRFSVSEVDLYNKQHEHFFRRVLLGSLRMCMAITNFHSVVRPNLVLVPGSEDFISQSLIEQSRRLNKLVSIFKWDLHTRTVKVQHPESREWFSCEFILERVSSMRNDSKTWPAEIVSQVRSLLSFLDISEDQLQLPLAR